VAATARVAKNSNRGSKPGERRGGREKGVPNRATAEIKAIAQEYTEQAIKVLADIMVNGESEAARVSAVNALLDRAYGKPSQAIEHTGEIKLQLAELIAQRRVHVSSQLDG
jgi:2,3-bisphosphoglycerate-independent phosphoglycerate mutase